MKAKKDEGDKSKQKWKYDDESIMKANEDESKMMILSWMKS